jgi:uncharacterized protein YihD (DUF1040 family)
MFMQRQRVIARWAKSRQTPVLSVYPPCPVQHDVKDLPDDVLIFLLGSRYCGETAILDYAPFLGELIDDDDDVTFHLKTRGPQKFATGLCRIGRMQ